MKTITVAQLCKTSHLRSLVMHQDTPLDAVINKFTTDHMLRGIFLVNDDNRLVAILNHHDLLNWARLRFGFSTREHFLSIGQVRRLVKAERVRDLAVPEQGQTAVTLEDSLATALEKMVKYNLIDIPVVDRDGRIVNDLLLSEILSFVLESNTLSRIG